MKRWYSHFFAVVAKRKVLIIAALGVLVVGAVAVLAGGNGKVETVSAKTSDLVRTVKISGKVVPDERVDLGFEIAGTILSADKKIGSSVVKGETLARLDASSVSAQLLGARAELASAQAELSKLEGTQVYENSIDNAKRSVVQAIIEAYSAATDAVYNKVDQTFYDPNNRVSGPTLAGQPQGEPDLDEQVESERVQLGYTLEKWQELIAGLRPSTPTYSDIQFAKSKEYLDQTVALVKNVQRAVNLFEASSFLSQSTIDGYRDALDSAQTSLSAASRSLIDKENALTKLLSDVPVSVAKVEAAKASVENLEYQLSRTRLVSPISGVVAKQDAKPGQTATIGAILVSVISKEFVIDTYVPEISIVGIKPGDAAKITLDAYGSKVAFDGVVRSIDPAETIRDGVSTYKTQIAFTDFDERIKSGMTANVEIETFRKANALLIPERTVIRDDTESYVFVLIGDRREKRVVTLGERDSKGGVEVLSGLSSEDLLIVNPESR